MNPTALREAQGIIFTCWALAEDPMLMRVATFSRAANFSRGNDGNQ